MRRYLQLLWDEWRNVETQINVVTDDVESIAEETAACRRLQSVPGVGALVSTALIAAIGNGSAFSRGRDFSAGLGLVPRQSSTGGKPRLLGISKRGNPYLRKMFIHGARSVVNHLDRSRHPLGNWMNQLEARARRNILVVAVANKIARVAWAVLVRDEPYQAGIPLAS